MANYLQARASILSSLRRELVGPDPQGSEYTPGITVSREESWQPWRQADSGEEILTRDKPTQRYGIGVLYSRGTSTSEPEDVPAGAAPAADAHDDIHLATDAFTASAEQAQNRLGDSTEDTDLDLSGANSYRPSTMAISFRALLTPGETVTLTMEAGRYQQRTITTGAGDRAWWFRSPCTLTAEWTTSALVGSGAVRATVTSSNLENLTIEVFAVSRPAADGTSLITAGIRNDTLKDSPDACLFQTRFTITSTAHLLQPYPVTAQRSNDPENLSTELLYRDYPTYAIGHGCAADWTRDPATGVCTSAAAEPLPAVEVPSITPDISGPGGDPLTVPMAPLAGLVDGNDGLAAAAEVVRLYEMWIAGEDGKVDALTGKLQDTARSHLALCRDAVERMREGLRLIGADPTVREAFTLANRAMLIQQVRPAGTRKLVYNSRTGTVAPDVPAAAADPLSPPVNRGTWRPFQIAFLLATLPSYAQPGHPDRELVDLIFFPTGGGKTEAYLGLAAIGIFLRRLRNNDDSGTEVLMRYTLRLLTTQQFQRAAALVCAMESIRRTEPRCGSTPFSIGIWVGADNTPNTRKQAQAALKNLLRTGEDNKFLIIRCPWCAAQIGPFHNPAARSGRNSGRRGTTAPQVAGYNEDGDTVSIHCTDPACEFATGLPLYVIDDDLYEHRPDIVLGTIDKFAQLAWRSETRNLFGIGPSGGHIVSPPGLIIQDELHLISGPLGSMTGLYETVIEELCTDSRSAHAARPKIVSSTATIRRYAEQVRGLFARERVALFPPHGLSASDSFFARYATYPAGHPQEGQLRSGRVYAGIHAPGLGSVQTAEVRTFAALLQAPMFLPEAERDPYWTLLTFFNSLRELGTSLSLLQSDIPDYLKTIKNRLGADWDKIRRLTSERELTSRLTSDDVPKAMDALSVPYPSRETIDTCLASSIIEVGIDIDRLSLLAVVGQPKSTSQYIQVTGRVGRRWQERPGLVTTIYSPAKPRDRSHYEKFRTYHERLYAQVEPTSVTPFAPPVLERALHAVLIARIRQRLSQPEARQPYPIPSDMIHGTAALLRARVKIADPDEAGALDEVLSKREHQWQSWEPSHWEADSASDDPGLLYRAGTYATSEQRRRSWPTPTSMRNVDAECNGVITGIYAIEQAENTP